MKLVSHRAIRVLGTAIASAFVAACGGGGSSGDSGGGGGSTTTSSSASSPGGSASHSSQLSTADHSSVTASKGSTASGSGGSVSSTSTTGSTASSTSRTSTGSTTDWTSSTTQSSSHATSSGASSTTNAGGFDPCPATGDCKILPLGDSITWGSTSNNGGYRVELFSRAVQDGKHITFVGTQLDGPTTVAGAPFPRNNEGHPGWTIAQITGIATASNALKDTPPIVLLHIGTNDLPNSLSGASDRLAQLVDQILAALPNSLLVVAQIIPLPWAESSVVTYNAAIPALIQQRAAQGKHVILVDMNTGFPSTNGYASDNIHPNDAVGYPWMGDRWYGAIASYLH